LSGGQNSKPVLVSRTSSSLAAVDSCESNCNRVGGCLSNNSGSWLVRRMVIKYPHYRVVCYDNMGYCSTSNNVKMLNQFPNFKFVHGNITNAQQVEHSFDNCSIDTVLHLAAESHVDHSFGNPYRFTYTNALSTQVILESAKKFHINRLVHMSTDEVYGEVHDTNENLVESSILVPTNPYVASKAARDYADLKSFNLPAIIIRCNNVYGPLQFLEKIIPKFTCLLKRRQKCCLHGTGQNTRRYLYAADAVSAIDTVLHKGRIGGIYNAGTDDELSNLQVFKHLAAEFGLDPDRHAEFTADRPFNDSRYAIDSRKMHQLGWKPQVPFHEGLRITVNWYLKHGETWWGNIDDYLQPFPETLDEKSGIPPLPLVVGQHFSKSTV
jgi:dTDP-glucose 4,6-dehydratase